MKIITAQFVIIWVTILLGTGMFLRYFIGNSEKKAFHLREKISPVVSFHDSEYSPGYITLTDKTPNIDIREWKYKGKTSREPSIRVESEDQKPVKVGLHLERLNRSSIDTDFSIVPVVPPDYRKDNSELTMLPPVYPAIAVINTPVILTAESDPKVSLYLWREGEKTIGNQSSVTTRFRQTGEHYITLYRITRNSREYVKPFTLSIKVTLPVAPPPVVSVATTTPVSQPSSNNTERKLAEFLNRCIDEERHLPADYGSIVERYLGGNGNVPCDISFVNGTKKTDNFHDLASKLVLKLQVYQNKRVVRVLIDKTEGTGNISALKIEFN